MPTITRTTSGMIGPDTATVQTLLQNARANFVAGNIIHADHINTLLYAFLVFNDHYHQTADYAFEAYGNTAPTGTFYDTNPENTSRMYAANGYQGWDGNQANYYEVYSPETGQVITAEKHEAIRNFFINANGHYHSIDDRVY